MSNLLLSGNIQEKIQWYIKAHGHSSIGSLNILWAYFSYQQDQNLTGIIEKTINEFETFSESNDIQQHLENVKKDVSSIKENIESGQLEQDKKIEMKQMIDAVNENIKRISLIIENPGYEESFFLQDILDSAITELLHRYPQTLYGNIIGEKNKESIQVLFSQQGTPRELFVCGYEMQLLFYNILSNGIDAMGGINGKGIIKIFFDYKNEHVHVDLSNTGEQIPEELVKKIRTKELFSTKGKNHGNGLKIINDLSEKYHTDVIVTSDENETVFSFDMTYLHG